MKYETSTFSVGQIMEMAFSYAISELGRFFHFQQFCETNFDFDRRLTWFQLLINAKVLNNVDVRSQKTCNIFTL